MRVPGSSLNLLTGIVLAVAIASAISTTSRAESVDYGSYMQGIVANAFVGEGSDDATAVATLNGRTLVAGRDLWVLNTGDTDAPRILGSVPLPGEALSIAIQGLYGYVATGEAGLLTVVRLTVPSHPVITDQGIVAGSAKDVVVHGDYAYVADGGGLRIFDVSEPENILAVGVYPAGTGVAVEIGGSTAYLATTTTIYTLDVSDPANVVRLGQFSTGGIRDLAYHDGMLYSIREGNGSATVIYDVSDPAQIIRLRTVNLQYPYPRAIDVEYPYVYACTAGIWTNMSLEVVDVSDPVNATVVGRTAGGFWDVADVVVENGIAYVADDIWGLNLVDVSRPLSVPILRHYGTGDFAEDLAIVGGHALVADRFDGLTVIDLATGAIAARLPTVGEVYRIEVLGDLAYLLGDGNLDIVDVADPVRPALLSTVGLPGEYTFDFCLAGGFAFIANGNPNLVIVNVADPVHPFIAGTYAGPLQEARGVAVAWPFAYLGDVWHGMHVVEISDPANPVGRGSASPDLPTWGYAGRLAVRGNHVYKADGYSGMWVADVTDPDNPQIASIHPNFVTLRCVVRGDILYTTRLDLGLQLWDLSSNPGSPALIGEVDTPGQVWGLAVGPEALYIADDREGIQVVPLHDAVAGVPDGALLALSPSIRVGPNPSSGPVRIEIAGSPGMVAGSGPPAADILDVFGRRVRQLTDPAEPHAGQAILLWDGRDEQGRLVPAGRYYVRTLAPGSERSGSVVIVR
jgi:hypothetical protein